METKHPRHDPLHASGARVFPIPPPLYFAAGFALGMRLHRSAPLAIPACRATAVAGRAAMAAGLALAGGGAAGVLRHRSTLVPHHEVSALVTSGAYRVSRNPMYTGLALVYTGGALRVRSWWPLVHLPAVLLLVRRLVIDPEERYLAERFGDEYAEYRRRVRRWL